jgi:hypothetical protein
VLGEAAQQRPEGRARVLDGLRGVAAVGDDDGNLSTGDLDVIINPDSCAASKNAGKKAAGRRASIANGTAVSHKRTTCWLKNSLIQVSAAAAPACSA